jgi:nucleoside-triphosphatase THEP1
VGRFTTRQIDILVKGVAGSGKSTVAQTVASQLKEKKRLGASFFFKRGEGDRGNAKRLFTTIVQQLVNRFPQLANDVQKAVQADYNISEKALGEQFNTLLKINLKDPITAVIVIDALDECQWEGERDSIRAILQLLPQMQTAKSIQVRLFLTSRPELPIRLGFKDIPGAHQAFDLLDVPRADIKNDISMFLKCRLVKTHADYHCLLTGLESPISKLLLKYRCHYSCLLPPSPLFYKITNGILMTASWRYFHASVIPSNWMEHMSRCWNFCWKDKAAKKDQLLAEYRIFLGTIIMIESPLSVVSLSALTGISKGLLLLNSIYFTQSWMYPRTILSLSG